MPDCHKVTRVNNIIPQHRNIRLFINRNVPNEKKIINFHRKIEKLLFPKIKYLKKYQKAYAAIENR